MQHQDIVDHVQTRLVEGAKNRETVFYEDFLADSSYGVVEERDNPNALGTVLREISREEVFINRPPISAICVRKKDGMAGPEFRSFMDPGEQLSEQQLKEMWLFMRDAVFAFYDQSKSKSPYR